ncbi:MAG: poly-gamma-glutamate system protein [Candidatus Aminicenantes bacterium]|nr:poly-gamma-glutamate system protein [Candidatus Aminicenantes bacterium]
MPLRVRDKVFHALGILSLLFLIAALFLARRPLQIQDEMRTASRRMAEAVAAVRECREAAGIPQDPSRDINRTGLIGLESSPITTSLGNLEAKRTTLNPNFAGLIVLLLRQAGVGRGETIAIGASSSFPGLITASLCAAEAMGLRPLLICSLGASHWGANHPEFHWLRILDCLNRSRISAARPIALSLGGDGDVGKDMSPEGRELLVRAVGETGLLFLSEPDLERNVTERIRLFESAAGGEEIRAFINVGGGTANIGTDSEILKVSPGLAVFSRIPPRGRRGLIFEMAARGIPVIHLLYVKGICERYGLPWDPVPLPEPGEGDLYREKEMIPWVFLALAGAYFLALAMVLATGASRA